MTRTYEKDPTWRLNTDTFEELWMSQWQLYQFSDLCHLLPASTNIVVSNLIQVPFLIFTIEGLAFAVYNGILSNDTMVGWIKLNDFKLNLPHTTPNCKKITHTHRSVGFKEIWLKVNIEERASEALDSVRDREYCDAFCL